MIIQLSGKVKFPITLDSSVWIFDDRKLIFDDAFSNTNTNHSDEDEDDELEKAAERFDLEIYQQKIKPPVNKSINRFEKEKILTNTYVMPIEHFIKNAEVEDEAKTALLHTNNGDVEIPVDQFAKALFLFAVNGKPLKEDGPVHLFYNDGSNKDNPIKGIKKVTFQ